MIYLPSGVQCLLLIPPLPLPWESRKAFFLGVLSQAVAQLTSTSPVRSLYLSRMTGSAVFSLRVLERSLKGCSRAGEGEERLISLSPRLKLLLCDPGWRGGDSRHKGSVTRPGSSRGLFADETIFYRRHVRRRSETRSSLALSGKSFEPRSLLLGACLWFPPLLLSDLSLHYII